MNPKYIPRNYQIHAAIQAIENNDDYTELNNLIETVVNDPYDCNNKNNTWNDNDVNADVPDPWTGTG